MSRRRKRKRHDSWGLKVRKSRSQNSNVEVRKQSNRNKLIIGSVGGVTSVTLLTILLIFLFWLGQQSPGLPKAAIVDQLSLTYPNPGFIQGTTKTLEQAGYIVDYYSGEEVTVDLYRYLPQNDYEYLLFRVHSTPAKWGKEQELVTLLFTSEEFSFSSHTKDHEKRTLGRVRYNKGAEKYFGIGPHFVQLRMYGRFDGAIIILMGCDVLRFNHLAQAFMDKGAKAVIGWDKEVSANHTDLATERLLKYLLVDQLETKEAVVEDA